MVGMTAWRWLFAGTLAHTMSGAIVAANVDERNLWRFVVVFFLALLVVGRWRLRVGAVLLLVLSGVAAVSSLLRPYEWWRLFSLPFDAASIACAVAARRRFTNLAARPA